MFETSTVQGRVIVHRRFGVLTASLAAHTLVVAGVVAAGISSISFPQRAPNELPAFHPIPVVDIPPPLGTHTAAHEARPLPAVAPATHAAAAVTAPSLIPATTLPVQSSTSQPGPDSSASGDSGPSGDPNGVADSIGTADVPATQPPLVPDVTYPPGGEVKAAVVLQRVEPEFPRSALVSRMGGTVVLRCVVGKNGEIRDAEVVSSTFGAFDRPALEALRRWKFAPGSLHGRAVDTWFELTIRFATR